MAKFQPNEAQEMAVSTIHGPVLLISCPGSGKTTTLVRRIHYMIESGIPGSWILMVTFSSAAAKEMRERYISLYGDISGVQFATIHSFCYNIILQEGLYRKEDLIMESESKEVVFEYLRKLRWLDDAFELAKEILSEISLIQNNYIRLSEYAPVSCEKELFDAVCRYFWDYKKRNHRFDFDDMLTCTKDILENRPDVLQRWQNRFPYIQCDEYQDTNFVQRDILKLLTANSKNLCVVGDDDQGIYQFRGARPEIMLGFEKDFPGASVIRMSTNYRSVQDVVDLASTLIVNNKKRFAKDFVSFRGSAGEKGKVRLERCRNKSDEMDSLVNQVKFLHRKGIAYKDMAILFRNNIQAQGPVMAFAKEGIPYYSTETVKSIYESFVFLDIQAYVKLSAGEGTQHDLLHVLNRPMRFLKEEPFRTAEYTRVGMKRAIAYLVKEAGWKYDAADKKIQAWMDAFGPGKVSLDDEPAVVFPRLVGAESIHYDDFLLDYAKKRNLDYSECKEMYDELKADALRFKTIREWFRHASDFAHMLRTETKKRDKEGVVVTTMHKSKGLEWKVVFIIDVNEKIIPFKKCLDSPDQVEEERRLMYVAMTRAKDELYVYTSSATPSRFIGESFDKLEETARRNRVPKKLAGTGVVHKRFGPGRVVAYSPSKIKVRFQDGTEKNFQFPGAFTDGFLKYT